MPELSDENVSQPEALDQLKAQLLLYGRAMAPGIEVNYSLTTLDPGYDCDDCGGHFTESHTCGDKNQHVHIYFR